PSFIDWASWLTLGMRSRYSRQIGLSPWLKHLGSKQRGSGSGAPKNIAPAFEALRNKADALYVVSDALIAANRARIVTLALSGRLPTMMSYDDYVEAGGLMSYGPDYPDLFRKAAKMVDKVLRGTKPGDIPVEHPTKFEFAINSKTAATLGLTIPQTFLATVDEVLK